MAGHGSNRDIATLHRLRGIVDDLVVRAGSDPPLVLRDAIGELDVALEELSVALEELHEQNDELESAHNQLEAERRYYAELFDLAPDAFLLSDEAGMLHGANRAAARLIGTTRDRVIGHPLASFVPVEERATFRSGLGRALRDPGTSDWTFGLTPVNRGTIEVSAHVALGRDSNGVPTDVRWVLRDVTDARRAQQLMQERFVATTEEAAALREADRWKDAFMAAAAHDLRSPLAIIEAASETLATYPELSDDRRTALLTSIRSSSVRVQRLLDDLLDLDRFSRGGVRPDRSRVTVLDLVANAIDLVPIASHPVHVSGDDVTADLDIGRVEQIVVNLVANAVGHTPAGTPVHVEVRATTDGVVLTVEDEGPGVPIGLEDDLFQPFVTRRTHAHDPPGTGLGLSLVLLFSRLHGGETRYERRRGGGARFVVELPGSVDDRA